MRVIAVDAGDDKAALCRELGAEVFIDFKKVQDLAKEVMRTTTYGAHGVVVYAASKAGYAAAPELLRVGGTVVAVGLPHDPDAVAGAHPMLLATKRLNVVGSVTGTLKVSVVEIGMGGSRMLTWNHRRFRRPWISRPEAL